MDLKCCKDSKTVLKIEIRLTVHELCDSRTIYVGGGIANEVHQSFNS